MAVFGGKTRRFGVGRGEAEREKRGGGGGEDSDTADMINEFTEI